MFWIWGTSKDTFFIKKGHFFYDKSHPMDTLLFEAAIHNLCKTHVGLFYPNVELSRWSLYDLTILVKKGWVMNEGRLHSYYSVISKYLLRYSNSLKYVSDTQLNLSLKVEDVRHPIQIGYVCPLCLKNYFIVHNDLPYTNAEFNEDHFPPQCVGGKKKVLVCEPCNNGAGRKHDWVIKKYLEAMSFLEGHHTAELQVKTKYKGARGSYNITLKRDNEIIKGKEAIIQVYSSKKYPLINDWVRDVSKEKMQMDMSFVVPSEEMVRRALLRSAYLYCFSVFGYSFAYSYPAKHLRAVINEEETHSLTNLGVFIYKKHTPVELGLYRLDFPKEYSCYTLNIPLKLKESKYESMASILIPLAHDKSSSSLRAFQDIVNEKSSVPCKYARVDEALLLKGKLNGYVEKL